MKMCKAQKRTRIVEVPIFMIQMLTEKPPRENLMTQTKRELSMIQELQRSKNNKGHAFLTISVYLMAKIIILYQLQSERSLKSQHKW
jgi:hypothetical protein